MRRAAALIALVALVLGLGAGPAAARALQWDGLSEEALGRVELQIARR